MAGIQQVLMHETLMQIIPLNSMRLSMVSKLSLCTSVYRTKANIICDLAALLHQEKQWH